MQLRFTYNFFEELHEGAQMLIHPDNYRDLRSVVWPFPGSLFHSLFAHMEYAKRISRIWNSIKQETELAFKRLNLRDLGTVTCYLHGISCEGWFDTDTNAIHVRIANVKNDTELADTIIHELLHLATYDDKLSYDEREELVNKYLSSPESRKIKLRL